MTESQMNKYRKSFVYVFAVLKTGIKENKRHQLVALCMSNHLNTKPTLSLP
jgi:hypothetical protein